MLCSGRWSSAVWSSRQIHPGNWCFPRARDSRFLGFWVSRISLTWSCRIVEGVRAQGKVAKRPVNEKGIGVGAALGPGMIWAK